MVDVVEMLIKHGANINFADGMEKETAFHTVVRSYEIDDVNKKLAFVRRKKLADKCLCTFD